jgi:hypothetical protein
MSSATRGRRRAARGPALLRLALAALALGTGAAGAAETSPGADAASPSYDELARFVAGLESGSPALADLERRPVWLAYARDLSPRWQAFEARQLAPMREWAARELPANEGAPAHVLYPFSGPDLVNPLTILPDRRSYTLLSLEPVGEIPDVTRLDEASLDAFLAGMQQALSSALRWDFFQTRELRRDLDAPGLRGVLPLLLFFAARDGQQVLDVRHLSVADDGTLGETPVAAGVAAPGTGVPGVALLLRRPGSAQPHEVRYFAVDLGGESMRRRQAFFSRVARDAPFTTYLKAASYLMFKPKYAAIERFVLDHSREVLQDDSGIPLAHLERRGWQVDLYGSYDHPIPLFAHRYQEDLARAYRARQPVPALPFAAGYKTHPSRSTLMRARRPEPEPTAPRAR